MVTAVASSPFSIPADHSIAQPSSSDDAISPTFPLFCSSPTVTQCHCRHSHGFFPLRHPPLHQSPSRSAAALLSLLRLFLRSHHPPMSPVVSSSLPPPVAVAIDHSCLDLLRHWTTPHRSLLFVIPRPVVSSSPFVTTRLLTKSTVEARIYGTDLHVFLCLIWFRSPLTTTTSSFPPEPPPSSTARLPISAAIVPFSHPWPRI